MIPRLWHDIPKAEVTGHSPSLTGRRQAQRNLRALVGAPSCSALTAAAPAFNRSQTSAKISRYGRKLLHQRPDCSGCRSFLAVPCLSIQNRCGVVPGFSALNARIAHTRPHAPEFDDELVLNQVFNALSDPTRRSIVAQLTRGEATMSEVASQFDMSLPGVSKHVSVLEDAGIVRRSLADRPRALPPRALNERPRLL